MSPRTGGVAIILAIVGAGTLLGILGRGRRQMDLDQWTVGGRNLGVVLVFLLMAGELFTTFSFLGASGWVYSRGAPTLYVLAFLPLGQVLAFHVAPRVRQWGRARGLQTQPDFFADRYGSAVLTIVVAVIGIAAVMPYLQLQLTGLGIIAEVASDGGLHRTTAILIAGAAITSFVLASGLRGVATVSLLKDFLMIVAFVSVGLAVPYLHFGGFAPLFARLAREHPRLLVMPGATANLGHLWFISSVCVSMLGVAWPHNFISYYAARSPDSLQRTAILMPLYTLSLGFVYVIGFAAVLLYPHLSDGDLALLTVVRGTFPPWFLGLVGGAGALTAMVPASVQALTAATQLAKNILCPLFAPQASSATIGRLSRAAVVVIIAGATLLACASVTSLVSLLLVGYDTIGQLAPGILIAAFWKRSSRLRTGVLQGIVAGIAVTAALILSHRDPWHGLNAGFVGLGANLAVVGAFAVLARIRPALRSDDLLQGVHG